MQSDNLLIHLHKLASSQDENFITETFAYLLRYLLSSDPDTGLYLLKKVSGGLLPITKRDVNSVSISTQVSTSLGTPDMEIRTLNHLVYVEAKVESDFGPNQLKRYKKALNNSGYQNTGLIAITRYPQDFTKGSKPNIVLRWHQLVDWLEGLKPSNELATYLINQFMEFMKLRGIAMENVTWELAAGVRSLQSLLAMLAEAVQANNVSITKSGGWEWHGYWIEDKKFFLGVYLSNPTVVEISSEVPLKPNVPKQFQLGLLEGNRWKNQLDLASEDVHFFARSKPSQLLCLESFVKKSLEYGRKLLA